MPTPDETKILNIIDAEGGECTVRKIAAKMRLEPNYARVILHSMGKNDIVDISSSGKIRIAGSGWATLGKKSQVASNGLKRYLEDRDKWKTF